MNLLSLTVDIWVVLPFGSVQKCSFSWAAKCVCVCVVLLLRSRKKCSVRSGAMFHSDYVVVFLRTCRS